MFNRAQWFLAGMSIALSLQLSQPVAVAVSVGKGLQTAQSNSSDAARKVLSEGVQLYHQQGTMEAKRSAIAKYEDALKLFREASDRSWEGITFNLLARVYSE